MSFAFGFSGDDVDDEEEEGEGQGQDALLAGEISKYTITESDKPSACVVHPKRHSLQDLLASLPSQLSYNILKIASCTPRNKSESPSSQGQADDIHIYRRSLFDIRAQLMAEANPGTQDEADTLLSGLENGDLTSGIYEGGFKTWECALDLASLVTGLDLNQGWEIIELGAGSAVPSLALLGAFLSRKAPGRTKLSFTLCDYNEHVLRLATAPNVLLNFLPLSENVSPPGPQEDGDLDIEELGATFVADTIMRMQRHNLSFDFISGGWGDSFLDLIPPSQPNKETPGNMLILASETIYSPSSIKTFTETLIGLLQRHDQGSAKAWVAAKKVYFGVGGGVEDFMSEVQSRGGTSRLLMETKDTGVGRVVLEITV